MLVFITTPMAIYLAQRAKLVDDPKKRKHPASTHSGVIPRAGGAALFIGIAIAVLAFLPITKLVMGILFGALLLVVIGLFDDKKDVHPYIRLGITALAAIIVIAVGGGIPFVTNPLTGGVLHLDTWRISFEFLGTHSILVWANISAFIWIIWVTNIVGWSAGVDGQMPGFVAIAAITLGVLALRFSGHDIAQTTVAALAFITAGGFLGFLPWNFYPQRIMPGYGGKALAGFLLAVLGILAFAKLGTALLVLGIPTIDAGYTLLRRLSKKQSPVWADRGHFHHRLLDLGWGRRRIALFYWIASAILGVIALTVTSQQKVFVLLLVAVAIGGFFLWVNFFMQLPKVHDRDSG